MPVRPLAVASASAALLIAGSIPAAARTHRVARCAGANTPANAASAPATRSAVVCLINHERAAYGLPALRPSRRLNRSAERWTHTMVALRDLTHGANFAARLTSVGFRFTTAGEDIASGYATPAQVVRGWMASPPHCRNILDPQFHSVGTGVVGRGIAIGYGPSTWTLDFALARGAFLPSDDWRPADAVC
jgi:uncharacterized protein YkwD